NIPEAGEITGMEIKDIDDMRRAAERIQALGPEHVIITGGHMVDSAVDVHYDGENFFVYRAKKKKGWYHGTGCVFSAAITAQIALGRDVGDAVKRAKDLVRKAIENNIRIGKGMSLLNF
ncbi:MAG: bifunctional hydroxymethylpyrimidine kinase/phosphomethylpyrimidine kinase, partial [bacterium]